MKTETTKKPSACDKVDELVVHCTCPLCVYGEHPIHKSRIIKKETPPPEGTLARTVWDARGGSAPRMMQRGFA